MSIDGLSVGTTSSATSAPDATQRARMSLPFVPMTRPSMAAPQRRAIHPAKHVAEVAGGDGHLAAPHAATAVT